MTRYEAVHDELLGLWTQLAIALIAPTCIVAIAVGYVTHAGVAVLGCVVLSPFVFHFLWRALCDSYRSLIKRTSELTQEVETLRRRIRELFAEYPERQKGQLFKTAYELNGRTVRELEEALSVGMFRERREVFVTAFMRNGVAVRVTASIGSSRRCRASDDPKMWWLHLVRHKCDELRQYHNHPVYTGETSASETDIQSTKDLRVLLGTHYPKLRSLILCWNRFGEWKVFEYDEKGRCWLDAEFDVATGSRSIMPKCLSLTTDLETDQSGA